MRSYKFALLFILLMSFLLPTARGDEPWRRNSVGISDSPPPPFTPVTVKMAGNSARIECWGRTYSLDSAGLPVQINSLNVDLLSSPVKLVIQSSGSPVEWKSTGVRLVKSNMVQAIVEGSADSVVGKLLWKCTAEYDGLLRYDIQFLPSGEASLSALELHFPLKAEHAKLNWRHEHYWPMNHYQGLLPPAEGVLDSGSWRPYIWLGDEDRGIALFTETPEPWQEITGKGEAFRLERKGGVVEVVWPFANGTLPWRLTKPWNLTFGIESTPVKDTTGWRKWRTSRRQTRDVVWTNNRNEPPGGPGINRVTTQDSNPVYTKHYGYPESADPKYYRSLVDKAHAMGYKFIPYFLPQCLGALAPEAKYLPQWRRDPNGRNDVLGEGEFIGISGGKPVTVTIHNRNADGSNDTFTTGPVNLQMSFTDPYIDVAPTPDWIDFMVWKCDKWVRELGADGLYADLVLISEATNPAAGLGYERDGVRYPTWPFFATRRLHQRLYTMLKQINKNSFYMIHTSRDLYIPYLAFCDGYLSGEGHASPTPPAAYAGKDYDELMPLDVIQAYFRGHNYGVPGYLCTQLSTRKDRVLSERYMISMSLLNDFGLRHDGDNIAKVYGAMDDFGIVEAQFLPYWLSGDMVGGQTDSVKVSIYRKSTGGALIVVSNLTRDTQQPTLTVTWYRLQTRGPLKVEDALTKEPVTIEGRSLNLEIDPLGFRLLRVR